MLTTLQALYATLCLRSPGVMAWLRQTSTIMGLMGIAGTVASAVQGSMTWAVAVPTLAAAVVALVLPGHPEAAESVRKAAIDAVLLTDASRRGEAIGLLVKDAGAIAGAMQSGGSIMPVPVAVSVAVAVDSAIPPSS